MEIFFLWLIFSLLVGFVGSGRNVGFWGAFFLSLILSPIIGLIIALVSKNKADEDYKRKVLAVQKRQQKSLQELSEKEGNKSISIADEIEKLRKLRDDNLITDDEFLNLKNKVINS